MNTVFVVMSNVLRDFKSGGSRTVCEEAVPLEFDTTHIDKVGQAAQSV
jgi:hypothetical protein